MTELGEKTHLTILKSRVASLSHEYKAAERQGISLDKRIKSLEEGMKTIHSNRQIRINEIEAKYEGEIADCGRQIQLSREVLRKKIEEREALLTYLCGLDLVERSFEELRDFDWSKLQSLAENLHKPKEDLKKLDEKAEQLNELTQEMKQYLTGIEEVLVASTLAKDRYTNVVKSFKDQFELWAKTSSMQKTRIDKLQHDNERLGVLLSQYISTDEVAKSDCLTKHFQAKSMSFLQSETPKEILEGLKKFKDRQSRVITVLRRKDDNLTAETNQLEVAKDQTHDQIKYYTNLIKIYQNGGHPNGEHLSDQLLSQDLRHMDRLISSQTYSQSEAASGA